MPDILQLTNDPFNMVAPADGVFNVQRQALAAEVAGRAYREVRNTQVLIRGFDPDSLLPALSGFGKVRVLDPSSLLVVGEWFTLTVSVDARGPYHGLFLACMVCSDAPAGYDPCLNDILDAVPGDKIKDVQVGSVHWYYSQKGDVSWNHVTELFDDLVLPEAYPYLGDLGNFIQSYLNSDEQVLILLGEPGTGKTRLIRHIIRRILDAQGKNLRESEQKWSIERSAILYTTSRDVLDSDRLYMDFLTSPCCALVLEDMDNNLKSRKSGNDGMARLLSASDGFLRNNGKKILLSTNIGGRDTDDALIRDGRCFAKIPCRPLSVPEAVAFLEAYQKAVPDYKARAARVAFMLGEHQGAEYPLSALYKMIKTGVHTTGRENTTEFGLVSSDFNRDSADGKPTVGMGPLAGLPWKRVS